MPKIGAKDAAWLACAIDSEGSVVIGKNSRGGKGPIYVPQISISNINNEWIQECARIINALCGNSCRSDAHQGKYAPVRRVQLGSFPRVVAVLNAILPYLIVKRDRALNLLAWNAHRAAKRKAKKSTRYDEEDLVFIRRGRELSHSKWMGQSRDLERT